MCPSYEPTVYKIDNTWGSAIVPIAVSSPLTHNLGICKTAQLKFNRAPNRTYANFPRLIVARGFTSTHVAHPFGLQLRLSSLDPGERVACSNALVLAVFLRAAPFHLLHSCKNENFIQTDCGCEACDQSSDNCELTWLCPVEI